MQLNKIPVSQHWAEAVSKYYLQRQELKSEIIKSTGIKLRHKENGSSDTQRNENEARQVSACS